MEAFFLHALVLQILTLAQSVRGDLLLGTWNTTVSPTKISVYMQFTFLRSEIVRNSLKATLPPVIVFGKKELNQKTKYKSNG